MSALPNHACSVSRITLPTVPIPGLSAAEAAGFVTYLVYRLRVSPRTVERRLLETLQFLAAPRMAGQRKVPTHQVDVVWHAMILHTHWYPKLCAALGQTFIHHRPNDYKGVGRRRLTEDGDCNNCNSPAACHHDCSHDLAEFSWCDCDDDCSPSEQTGGRSDCEDCVACDCD